MNVLFVDDEPKVLHGLRRMLFDFEEGYDFHFVESGAAALDWLGHHPCDLVVTDMRMPGMDGTALLHSIYKNYPHIVRVVLSGQADEGAALSVVPVAHQFLLKPCTTTQLRDVMLKANSFASMQSRGLVRQVIGRVGALPSAPKLYLRLMSMVNETDTDLNKVADLIGRDASLAARVLQVVNSSFFSRGIHTTSVRNAVTRLGLVVVRQLVLQAEVFSRWAGCQLSHNELEVLVHRGLAAAHVAEVLSKGSPFSEEAVTGAIIADVGQMLVASDPYLRQVSDYAVSRSGRASSAIELTHLGVTHADVGAHLLNLWNLPKSLVDAVRFHHTPTPDAVNHGMAPWCFAYLAYCWVDAEVAAAEVLSMGDLTLRMDRWLNSTEAKELREAHI